MYEILTLADDLEVKENTVIKTVFERLRDRHSSVVQCVGIDVQHFRKRLVEELDAVKLCEYGGDWGFNAGTFHLAFHPFRHNDKLIPYVEMYLVHQSHEMDPFQRTPEYLEYMLVEEVSMTNLRKMRDTLNEILDEFDSQ